MSAPFLVPPDHRVTPSAPFVELLVGAMEWLKTYEGPPLRPAWFVIVVARGRNGGVDVAVLARRDLVLRVPAAPPGHVIAVLAEAGVLRAVPLRWADA